MVTTDILCPICKIEGQVCGEEGVTVYYHHCTRCDTVWLSDRALYNKAKKAIYNKEYVSKMNSPEGINRYRRLSEQYFNLLHFITKANGRCKSDPFSFLEIGFSLPSIITYFYKYGYDVTALDIKIAPEIKTRLGPLVKTNRLRFIESDFESWQADKNFDVLWMSHVLEHYEDTMAALAKIRSLLKGTGVAFISSPDAGVTKELGIDSLMGHMHPEEHLFMYSIETFAKICNQYGLKVCFSERYGDPIPDHFEFVTKMEWRAIVVPEERTF